VIYTQEGMSVLAQETGGLFLQGTNDVAGALRKAAEDSDGYYLIGYHPDANTVEDRNGQPKFHKIGVKVTRTGWHVRSREPTAEYRSRCSANHGLRTGRTRSGASSVAGRSNRFHSRPTGL
jgi:hypothetical protein